MGLISPGGENLQDFLELRQVLSTYDGDFRDLASQGPSFPSWKLVTKEGANPCIPLLACQASLVDSSGQRR